MKRGSPIRVKFLKFIFMVVLVLTFSIPIQVLAQDLYYISAKPGIYSPKLNDCDTGFNGEIAFGWRPNPNFAAEMGVGYFETEAKERFRGQLGGITFTGRITADIEVIPVTITLKGILPYKQWEFFGLGGIGAYIVSGDLKARGTVGGLSGAVDLEDSATIFGFHLGLGFHYNITPTIFVGAEGKYLWTSEAKLQDEVFGVPIEAKFKMDGILATAVIGLRF